MTHRTSARGDVRQVPRLCGSGQGSASEGVTGACLFSSERMSIGGCVERVFLGGAVDCVRFALYHGPIAVAERPMPPFRQVIREAGRPGGVLRRMRPIRIVLVGRIDDMAAFGGGCVRGWSCGRGTLTKAFSRVHMRGFSRRLGEVYSSRLPRRPPVVFGSRIERIVVVHDRSAQYVQRSGVAWVIRTDFEYGSTVLGDDEIFSRCLDELEVFECASLEFGFRNGSVRHHGKGIVI